MSYELYVPGDADAEVCKTVLVVALRSHRSWLGARLAKAQGPALDVLTREVDALDAMLDELDPQDDNPLDAGDDLA